MSKSRRARQLRPPQSAGTVRGLLLRRVIGPHRVGCSVHAYAASRERRVRVMDRVCWLSYYIIFVPIKYLKVNSRENNLLIKTNSVLRPFEIKKCFPYKFGLAVSPRTCKFLKVVQCMYKQPLI